MRDDGLGFFESLLAPDAVSFSIHSMTIYESSHSAKHALYQACTLQSIHSTKHALYKAPTQPSIRSTITAIAFTCPERAAPHRWNFSRNVAALHKSMPTLHDGNRRGSKMVQLVIAHSSGSLRIARKDDVHQTLWSSETYLTASRFVHRSSHLRLSDQTGELVHQCPAAFRHFDLKDRNSSQSQTVDT